MKVTPKTKERKQVDFTTLKIGQEFYWHGALWIRVDDSEQGAVNLETGEYFTNNCSEYVVPVEATLTWKFKEQPEKKK